MEDIEKKALESNSDTQEKKPLLTQENQNNESKKNQIEIFSILQLDGSTKKYSTLKGGNKIEVERPIESRNIVETKTAEINKNEAETVKSLEGEENLQSIEDKSKETMKKSEAEALFMNLFQKFIWENEGEIVVIKENDTNQFPVEVPSKGAKYLITATAGEKFKTLLGNLRTIENLNDPSLGFVLLDEQQEPEYTFLYSIEEEKDDKSEDKEANEEKERKEYFIRERLDNLDNALMSLIVHIQDHDYRYNPLMEDISKLKLVSSELSEIKESKQLDFSRIDEALFHFKSAMEDLRELEHRNLNSDPESLKQVYFDMDEINDQLPDLQNKLITYESNEAEESARIIPNLIDQIDEIKVILVRKSSALEDRY